MNHQPDPEPKPGPAQNRNISKSKCEWEVEWHPESCSAPLLTVPPHALGGRVVLRREGQRRRRQDSPVRMRALVLGLQMLGRQIQNVRLERANQIWRPTMFVLGLGRFPVPRVGNRFFLGILVTSQGIHSFPSKNWFPREKFTGIYKKVIGCVKLVFFAQCITIFCLSL